MSSSLSPRQNEPLGADDGLSFDPRPSLPTVIVKRSRLAGLERPADETRPATDAGVARDPKVFRVAAASPPERQDTQVPTARGEDAPPTPPRRRKRDPLRAPVLLRHEVIAPPPAEAPPPPATADYRAVCQALEDLQRDLALVRQARSFKLTRV